MIAIIHKGRVSQHAQTSVCADLNLGWFNLDDDDSCRFCFLFFHRQYCRKWSCDGGQCGPAANLSVFIGVTKKQISFQRSWVHSGQLNGTWSWCGSFGLVWTRWAKMKFSFRFFMLFLQISLVQSFSMQFPTGLPHAICLWYEDASNWIRPECSDKTNAVKEQQQPAFEGVVTDIIIVIITIIFSIKVPLTCSHLHQSNTLFIRRCLDVLSNAPFCSIFLAILQEMIGAITRRCSSIFNNVTWMWQEEKLLFLHEKKKKHKLIWNDRMGGGSRLELGWWIGVVSAFCQRQIWAGKQGNAPTQQLVWTWGCERRGTVLWNSTVFG